MTVWVSNFLTLIVIVKIGCMVTMGNSSSSSSSRLSRDESYYDDDNNIPADVSISCIKNHLRSGVPAQEFMRLEHNAPGLRDTLTEAQRICNKEKNRYVNILPCDSTRVRLVPIAGVDGSDYINANFIDGVTDRAYIATQGPLPHTRGDFWRMVWENTSTIVVMLGKEKENERVKVDRYWPEEGEGSLHFSGLKVTLVDKRYDQELGIAVRRLRITRVNSHPSTLQHVHTNTNLVHSNSNQNIHGNSNVNNTNTNTNTNTNNTNHQNNNEQEFRDVIHYQYEGWPDHGVPDSAAPIRKLVRIIEQERALTISQYPWSPMVVHCSAGVGRTGTFITVHMTLLRLFQEMNADSSGQQQQSLSHSTSSLSSSTRSSSNLSLVTKFNLYDTVLKLRKQRPGMVQQQEQYIFCYEAVAEEAEHLGLIPPSPVTPRRSPRTLSISTSSLPSPSSSATLRTSSSSYLSSPTGVPPSPPDFLASSGQYFLNSSTASLPAPSPPSSPYIHNTALDCSTPSLFPPPVDCRK